MAVTEFLHGKAFCRNDVFSETTTRTEGLDVAALLLKI